MLLAHLLPQDVEQSHLVLRHFLLLHNTPQQYSQQTLSDTERFTALVTEQSLATE